MVLPGPSSLREPDRAGDVDAARAAEQSPSSLHQVEDNGSTSVIGDLEGVVDLRALEVAA